jgi:quercetin dioxygenase-like cupin family protein
MPILKKSDVEMGEIAPGVERWEIVNGELGADSLTVADLTLAPGSKAPTHTHPTEEAMIIVGGELEAVLGDEVVTVKEGETVLAPAGVKHGFVNRSGSSARVMGVFPTGKVERTLVD